MVGTNETFLSCIHLNNSTNNMSSNSIGEEGLDIGEVDLIVNFDCLRSPIRMVQRTG